MKRNEIVKLVDTMGFYMGDRNYESTHKNRADKLDAIDARIDAVEYLAFQLNVKITHIRSHSYFWAAVWCKLSDTEIYVKWCTSCDDNVDRETWAEFETARDELIKQGYTLYFTNGKGGLQEIN